MRVEGESRAEHLLARLNYYRLSGYWYPMRRFPQGDGPALDEFQPGASFELVVQLYEFDERLRHGVFIELDRIEMAIRAMLGHELGRLDPLIHLKPDRLGPKARQLGRSGRTVHSIWLRKYESKLETSQEDFVIHHRVNYRGEMPIWAAVEIMDWGMLSYLYEMAPQTARDKIASRCALTGPQLQSWLRSLNVLRNLAAHHARMFNRVYGMQPKLNNDQRLAPMRDVMNRAFGQLTLIQYLHRQLDLSPAVELPAVMRSYPHNDMVPFSRTGAPAGWSDVELWVT